MKYAIVESGGKQFRAVEGATIEVDRLPVEIGKNIKLEQVLLLADGGQFTVGKPVIQGHPVWAKVVEHFKGEKVTIFNYSPKKRIRVKTGHRQKYTRLLIEQIGGAELVKKEPVQKAEKPARLEKDIKAEKPKAAAKPAARAEKKAAPKVEPKPVKKTPAKPAAKPVAKPAAKAAVKPAAKPAAKPAKTSKVAPKTKTGSEASASKGKTAAKKSKTE